MSTRFEHRATFTAPATTVYSALVDPGFLEDRLRAIGGKGAKLVEHESSGERVAFRLRQGVEAEKLPGAARAFLNGDLVVERSERWEGDSGTGRASITGVPGEITSRTRVNDRPDGGSELVTEAEVRVGIPLVGGKLEQVVAAQVGKLLAAESEYAATWLAQR